MLLPHSRRAEAAQLRQDGATACLTRPLVAAQVALVAALGQPTRTLAVTPTLAPAPALTLATAPDPCP